MQRVLLMRNAQEKPILFSGPMVRAILAGRKTQTRRLVKPQPDCFLPIPQSTGIHAEGDWPFWADGGFRTHPASSNPLPCPYPVGTRLWVKENYRMLDYWDKLKPSDNEPDDPIRYESDGAGPSPGFGKLRPSLFMMRWMSRITLEVTAARIERLNDISEADAKAEGVFWHEGGGVGPSGWKFSATSGVYLFAEDAYAALWGSLNGPGSWAKNPLVWAYTFRRAA